jgi:hypothetical protein
MSNALLRSRVFSFSSLFVSVNYVLTRCLYWIGYVTDVAVSVIEFLTRRDESSDDHDALSSQTQYVITLLPNFLCDESHIVVSKHS